jgi:hypothetical protein
MGGASMRIIEKMLTEMFSRLLNVEISPQVMKKLIPVVGGVSEKIHGTLDLDTVQDQDTFRALICSMIAHGWGLGMHPDNNPVQNLDGKPLEVKVCKDILVPMETLKSIRYVQKDEYGRVKKALFEPDQNARIWNQIDEMLGRVAKEKWHED